MKPDMSVADEVILVVDDVTTSDNSLYTCRDILMRISGKEMRYLYRVTGLFVERY